MPLLALKKLTVKFGGLTAVSGVDCALNEHNIVSIIGPNGAGKTTVFNAITGIYEPTSGTIEFEGNELARPFNRRVVARAFLVGLLLAVASLLVALNVDSLWRVTIKRNYAGAGQPFSWRAAAQSGLDYFWGRLAVVPVAGGRWSVVTPDGRRMVAFADHREAAEQIRQNLQTLMDKVSGYPNLIPLIDATQETPADETGQVSVEHGEKIRYVDHSSGEPVVLAEYDSTEAARAALESLVVVSREADSRRTRALVAMVCGFFVGAAGILAVWRRWRRSPDFISRTGIARTFQNIRLFHNMTVLENVLVAMDRKFYAGSVRMALCTPQARREEQQAAERAREWLRFVGLDQRAGDLAKNLPYGAQRRLEIARALATEPRVLLLDEPAAGMNPAESAELSKLIEAIRQRGLSVLLIEHHMRVVMNISDRIAVLDYGQKIAEGTPAEVRANPEVIKAYLGSEEVT